MMAKVPAFAKAFDGGWRIAEMDVWDTDALDLVEPAHVTFRLLLQTRLTSSTFC
jgi:hypothetical protein